MLFITGIVTRRILVPAAATLAIGLAKVVVKRIDEATSRRDDEKKAKRPRKKARR